MAKVTLFAALDAAASRKGIKGFPPVVVDQTNCRIGEIIKRNLAGEQVMGNQNLSFDYTIESKNPDTEKVNPFNDLGFDLDDVVVLAKKTGQQVTEFQNRQGELKRQLDEAKKVEEEQKKVQTPVSSSEPPKEPAK